MLITGHNTEVPVNELPFFAKEKLDDVKVSEVKYFNCSSEDSDLTVFDLDSSSLAWPQYRDWNSELYELERLQYKFMREVAIDPYNETSFNALVQLESAF